MTRVEYVMRAQAIETGLHCLRLYWWSRSAAQWAQRYESVTGEFEWFFW